MALLLNEVSSGRPRGPPNDPLESGGPEGGPLGHMRRDVNLCQCHYKHICNPKDYAGCESACKIFIASQTQIGCWIKDLILHTKGDDSSSNADCGLACGRKSCAPSPHAKICIRTVLQIANSLRRPKVGARAPRFALPSPSHFHSGPTLVLVRLSVRAQGGTR